MYRAGMTVETAGLPRRRRRFPVFSQLSVALLSPLVALLLLEWALPREAPIVGAGPK
jgi:hypothetical protein